MNKLTKDGILIIEMPSLDHLIIRKKKVELNLKLITFSNNVCTMGKLYNGKELICHTFELPWLKNSQNVSCIPAGSYTIKMTNSNKFGPSYEVKNVGGRSNILIHKGNTIHDTLGCILPVSTYGLLPVRVENKSTGVTTSEKTFAGLSSGKAYNKLMHLLEGKTHDLTIERH